MFWGWGMGWSLWKYGNLSIRMSYFYFRGVMELLTNFYNMNLVFSINTSKLRPKPYSYPPTTVSLTNFLSFSWNSLIYLITSTTNSPTISPLPSPSPPPYNTSLYWVPLLIFYKGCDNDILKLMNIRLMMSWLL